jgi:hypothetical protein
MKSVHISVHGAVDEVQMDEIPVLTPKPAGAVLGNPAASINHADPARNGFGCGNPQLQMKLKCKRENDFSLSLLDQ